MSVCSDNPSTGRIGCGAVFAGRTQHSVARVPWSAHADGRAHATFTGEAACDRCWKGETLRDPATVVHTVTGRPLLEQDERGRWRLRRDPADDPNTAATASEAP